MYRVTGILFVALGVIGAFVPVMPTTIFLILALACFSRSDERLERWLLDHPRFGPTLRDWSEKGSIKLRTKWIASLLVVVALGASIFVVADNRVKIVLAATAVAICAYIWTRPTTASC